MSAVRDDRPALVWALARILQAALEAHESIERHTHVSVVHELIELIGFRAGVVPFEEVASLLFAYAAFGRPISRNQQRLQEDALARLVEGDDGLLYRQLCGEPLRGWRYVPQRSGRAVAHQLAGPRRDREELFDLAVAIDTGEVLEAVDGLAWTATVGGLHVLLVARTLSEASTRALGRLRPFPQPNDEVAFWIDQVEAILASALDPEGNLARLQGDDERMPADAFRDGQRLSHSPVEQPRELLERVVLCAGLDVVQRRADWFGMRLHRQRWPRELIARARTPEDLEPLRQAFEALRYQLLGWAVQGRFTGLRDPALEAWLPMDRIFAAFGVEGGAVPAAEPASLMTHPFAVLRLDDAHPVCSEVHPRDAIRVALSWSRAHLGEQSHEHLALVDAFERYRTERRWVATWDAFAVDDAGHLDRIDYAEIIHGLREVFDPAVLQTPIAELGLEPRHLTRLETALRLKPYGPENLVRVESLPGTEPAVLELRSVGPGVLVQLKAALVTLARGWRTRGAGLDARALEPTLTQNGAPQRQALQDGLDELAALFGDTE